MQRMKISPAVKGKFAAFSIILDLFREKVLSKDFAVHADDVASNDIHFQVRLTAVQHSGHLSHF